MFEWRHWYVYVVCVSGRVGLGCRMRWPRTNQSTAKSHQRLSDLSWRLLVLLLRLRPAEYAFISHFGSAIYCFCFYCDFFLPCFA